MDGCHDETADSTLPVNDLFNSCYGIKVICNLFTDICRSRYQWCQILLIFLTFLTQEPFHISIVSYTQCFEGEHTVLLDGVRYHGNPFLNTIFLWIVMVMYSINNEAPHNNLPQQIINSIMRRMYIVCAHTGDSTGYNTSHTHTHTHFILLSFPSPLMISMATSVLW